MPPRGRPRKGLSRMDAAVDAMAKFGFEKGLVRRQVNQLLREYGGDEFWPFIEDCSYKELLEAILREQETDNLENVATGQDQIEDKEELVGPEQEPLGSAEPIYPNSIHSTTPVINNVSDGNGWKDIHPNQAVENEASGKDRESPRREDCGAEIRSRRRCLHFYGWIDRYEEDDDEEFITLRPSSMVVGPPPKAGKCLSGETRKRRSRWDVRPADP